MSESTTVPSATYRLQLNKDFGFDKIVKIVGYLKRLGITHIYASPVFAANPESMHGYDVTDPNVINDELNEKYDFIDLMAFCKDQDMGWVQDIVPNHMAYSSHNRMMASVLMHGRGSAFAEFFDIDWDHPHPQLKGKVMAPFLGKDLADAVADGEISLIIDEFGLRIKYYQQWFPVTLPSYKQILTAAADLAQNDIVRQMFDQLLARILEIETMSAAKTEYTCAGLKQTLSFTYAQTPAARQILDSILLQINQSKGQDGRLMSLLNDQHYALTHFKAANERIDYRRFFYINGLIGLRVEDESVFEKTHALILNCVQRDYFAGLRVDHVDGLTDPTKYLERLRTNAGDKYIVVEKILEKDEPLPDDWPIEGTTGYEFGSWINAVQCDNSNAQAFDLFYREIAPEYSDYRRLLYDKKREVLQFRMAGDVANLVRLLNGSGSFTDDQICAGVTALAAAFGTYRTYLGGTLRRKYDLECVKRAVECACEFEPDASDAIWYLSEMLQAEGGEKSEFVKRFQQLTAPAMAKGFEDTLLYIYNRHIALNEVGGAPDEFGMSVSTFHNRMSDRASNWPHTMNATSTHDSKRGEDVRARLNVLSEMPEQWFAAVRQWQQMNVDLKRATDEGECPDANDEFFIYQTMIGALPFASNEYDSFKERLKAYTTKSLREAKQHTSWLDTDADYEQGVLKFIDGLFKQSRPFWDDFLQFQECVCGYGVLKSLAQVVLKLTCPGVPDIYQGSELWNLSLVDPDNRRPVDYDKRMQTLESIRGKTPGSDGFNPANLLADPADAAVKMYVISRMLHHRLANSELYRQGSYMPLAIAADGAGHVIAYAREYEGSAVIAVMPCFCCPLTDVPERGIEADKLGDAVVILPQGLYGRYEDIFTGKQITLEQQCRIADLICDFPVAVLAKKD